MTKTFLDTNVIVSARIQVNSKKFGAPITHPFFQESMHLLAMLRKITPSPSITSKTVEGETYATLIKAVKYEVDKHTNGQNIPKADLFNEFSRISNICLNRARQQLSFITIESVDKSEKKQNLGKIEDMVRALRAKYDGNYANPMNRDIAAKRRRDTTLKYQWKTEMRKEVYRMFREQVEREAIQICQFLANEPNNNINDKQILAEAITIKNSLVDNSQFYIVSNDKKFFAPIRLKGGAKSDLVTSEINNRFGIICDTPREIRKKIQEL